MDWFSEWWAGLLLIEQILYCIAIPSTVILLIQTVLLLIGFGGNGEGVNPSDTSAFDAADAFDGGIDSGFDMTGVSGDASGAGMDMDSVHTYGSAHGDFGLMSLFTLQGVVSFLCVFSWSAIVMVLYIHFIIALIIAFLLGFLTMFGVAKIIRLSAKLAQNGTLNVKILLGETGTVYVPIPSAGHGIGKITISLAERFIECDAVNESDSYIPTNTSVRVVDILSGNVLVVEKTDS